MARRNSKVTDPKTASYNSKMKASGIKVKHVSEKKTTVNDMGKNRNGAYTSNGSNTQYYNPETKSFTKTAGSSKYGRLAVDGESNARNARTWTFTDKENGRQSGRSQTATRRQRYYDVRAGLGLAGG